MSAITKQELQLGNVTFYNFEVPESLPNLFGVQKLAVHDFPSQGQGNRTVQQLGSFPFPDISWTGIFFDQDGSATLGNGPSAIDRASQINTYRVQGDPIQLIWGPFQYEVIVAEFEIIGRLKQQLEYRIKLVPTVDRTTTSNTPPSVPNANQVAFDANTGVTKATTSGVGLLLSGPVRLSAAVITQNATAAIIASNNNVSNLSSSQKVALQSQILLLQTTLNPLINGSDYGQASAASILSASLFTLGVALGIGQATSITTITVTNPSLPQLASLYYNNNSLWPLIAQANNLQEMFPIGTFTLVIPQQNTQSDLIPTS